MEITKDNKTLVLKNLKELIHTSSYLMEIVEKEQFEDGMKSTLLSLLEYKLKDINKYLDRESDLNKDMEERTVHLRKANNKIRELEDKISTMSLEKIKPYMIDSSINKTIDSISKKWRDPEIGLGGLVKVNIHQYYVEIRFVPMLTSFSSSFSETPETDKLNYEKWMKSLKEEGFTFSQKSNSDLLVTDKNIELLKNKIRSIIPTISFTEIKNINFNNEFMIRDIAGTLSLEELMNANIN